MGHLYPRKLTCSQGPTCFETMHLICKCKIHLSAKQMSRACSYYSVRNSHLGLQGKGKHSTKQKHRVPADGTKMMHCNSTLLSVNKKKQICSKTCTIAEELPKTTMLSCKVASAKNQTTNDQICAPTPHVWRKRKKCVKKDGSIHSGIQQRVLQKAVSPLL